MIVILIIIDGIAFLASRIAALTIAPFLLDVDINDNNVPPATGTSTLGSVTIHQAFDMFYPQSHQPSSALICQF